MEVELKYNITSKEQMDEIWEDQFLRQHEEKGSRRKIFMKAAYFDADYLILSKNDIAFRIRSEGDRVVGTLKWRDRDTAVSGLYIREEVNVPVKDEACFIAPKPEIFQESAEGRDLLNVLGGKPLHCVFEARFTRRKFRIDHGVAICEISLDEGEIVSDRGSVPISELEIELYSGKQEDLLEIGNIVVAKYGIRPEPRSKYSRGVELLG
jgi:inorganic triphosphatase YgiF